MGLATAASSEKCDQCKSTGLPILPLRYTVVPNSVPQGLPEWAKSKKNNSVKLGKEFKYALRTMREGFIYLFYSKNARGSNKWECYTVWADGSMHQQADTELITPISGPTLICSRHGHNLLGVHYLVIEQPEKCGTTWIAFSERKLSQKTIDRYTADPTLRKARMQAFEPAAMAKSAVFSYGTKATEAALNTALEYSPAFDVSGLPHDSKLPTISQENGLFKEDTLSQVCTRYAYALRTGLTDKTIKHMASRAKESVPQVIALWDAIGITHELNGFRNDAAGWVEAYSRERELQIAAMNYIEGAKNARSVSVHSKDGYKFADPEIEKIRWQAANRYGKGSRDNLHNPLKDVDGRYTAHVISESEYKTERSKIFAERSTDPAAMESIYADIDRRRQSQEAKVGKSIKDDWDKYWDKIDETTYNLFDKNWKSMQEKADTLIDERTKILINWLEAPLLLDTLEDFHETDIRDGVLFEAVVGESIFGIGTSKSGKKKMDEWIDEAQSKKRSNLLWRAVALNQDIGKTDLDNALALAKEHQTKRTVATALTIEGIVAKTLKAFADVHKRAAGVFTANTSAASELGSTAFGVKINPIKTYGLDHILTTFMDRLIARFRVPGLADYISEKLILHMFSLRAYVVPEDSIALLRAQSEVEKDLRKLTIERIRSAPTFSEALQGQIQNDRTEDLKKRWEKFKTGNKGPDGIRDARLAVLVMLAEGINFQKLLLESFTKGDNKTFATLLASGMTLASGLCDIAAVPAKNLFADPAKNLLAGESWTYQRLKLSGALLSIGATVIGIYFDYQDAKKFSEKNQSGLVWLYSSKALLGVVSGFLTAATGASYAAPLIARLTGKETAAMTARAVSEQAAKMLGARILIGARIFTMTWGGAITVIIFAVQGIVWYVVPNDLMIWCDNCAFGKSRIKDWTPEKQKDVFFEAAASVGF